MATKKYDLTQIMAEFDDDDFGFSTVDENEYEAVIAEKDETVEEYKQRLEQVEKIILPFLNKLLKTADQAVIKWPYQIFDTELYQNNLIFYSCCF